LFDLAQSLTGVYTRQMARTDSISEERPLIGITGRRVKAGDVAGSPATVRFLDTDLFYTDLGRGVFDAGGLPVLLPLDVEPSLFVETLDGILFSGGADLDPASYGAASETDEFPPQPARDEFEFDLLAAAFDKRLAVLGICRGVQVLNVFAGGSLHQHVPEHGAFEGPPDALLHEVEFEQGSTLASMYGSALKVNSLHHQTIDRVGDGFVVAARAGDGTVEGLQHERLPVLGVQWHPEFRHRPDLFLAGRHGRHGTRRQTQLLTLAISGSYNARRCSAQGTRRVAISSS